MNMIYALGAAIFMGLGVEQFNEQMFGYATFWLTLGTIFTLKAMDSWL